MAEGTESRKSEQKREEETDCVFCKIVAGKTDTELLYEDESIVCFRDIHPDALHHYLVIPKAHTPNVKYLSSEHIPLIEEFTNHR